MWLRIRNTWADFKHDGLYICHIDGIMLTGKAIHFFPLESGIREIWWFSLLLFNITQDRRPEEWIGYKYRKEIGNINID